MVRWLSLIVILLLSIHPAEGQQPGRHTLMADSAQAFLSSLDQEQKRAVVRPIEDQEARTNWHYLPADLAPRIGISLAELRPEQRTALHGMLAAALSSQGYGKLSHIMWLEEFLRESEGAALRTSTAQGEALERQQARLRSRDPSKYWVVLFGDPGSGDWGWTLSGHHFAVNFTVTGGRVAFTPLFLGANPQTIPNGEHAGERTLQHEIDKAFRLVQSLVSTQRETAVRSTEVPASITADKGRKGEVTRFEGLPADRLDADQRQLLFALLDEFLADTSEEIAAAQRSAIENDGLAALHFAWWGQTNDPNARFMYRIHGPSILIEFVRERNPDGGPANHVHAIVRDPRNDYGEAWLQQHYREYHQPSP